MILLASLSLSCFLCNEKGKIILIFIISFSFHYPETKTRNSKFERHSLKTPDSYPRNSDEKIELNFSRKKPKLNVCEREREKYFVQRNFFAFPLVM